MTRSDKIHWAVFILITCAAIVMLIASVLGAHAHDKTRPELNDWFSGLYSGEGNCCSSTDGTALADPDWQQQDKCLQHSTGEEKCTTHSTYRVRVEGEWMDVPDKAIVHGANRYGPAIVWPLKGANGATIRCFMPGGQM